MLPGSSTRSIWRGRNTQSSLFPQRVSWCLQITVEIMQPWGCHLTSGSSSLKLLGMVGRQNITPKSLPSARSSWIQKWQERSSNSLVWGWKCRLTHFSDFPCCWRPAYSHCEIMKWVTLRVREHMTGEFELFRGKEFKDKMDKMDKNEQKAWTFSLNPCRKMGLLYGSLLSPQKWHHCLSSTSCMQRAGEVRSIPSANPCLKACDRPEPLLTSQLLRLENMVLSFSFFLQL